MRILRVLALFWATSVMAGTTPANDIYSDSLTTQRESAEVPQSLAASRGGEAVAASGAAIESLDTQPIESVQELVESARPRTKKSARK